MPSPKVKGYNLLGAVLGGKSVGFGSSGLVVVEACIGNGPLFLSGRERSEHGVTSEHAEACWESEQLLGGGATALPWGGLVYVLLCEKSWNIQIINQSSTNLLDGRECAILSSAIRGISKWLPGTNFICNLLEEIGDPVVAEILLDGARRTGGSTSLIEVHGEIKTISTHDGVQMTGDLTRTRKRIRTFDTDRIITRQTPEGRYFWEEA